MIESKNKISIHQMQILTIFNILGSSFLTFPKLISKSSDSSFIFSIILGILFIVVSTILIICSLKVTDTNNFNDFFEKVLGHLLTKIIYIVFILKIIFSLTIITSTFVDMTESILLPKTSSYIILISFLSLSSYLCYKEQSVRAKTSQLIFYIFILYIIFFIFVSMFKLQTENLPNLLYIKEENLVLGSFVTFFSFSSIIYFFFDFFFVDNKSQFLKSSINVVLLTGIMFLFITLISISTFTLTGVTFLSYPSFDTMSRLSITNSFITRSEAIVFMFWIFVIFSFITTGIFYGHLIFFFN